MALSFGAVDYSLDINASPEAPDGRELLFARSQLVVASRVAGVQPPIDSVYVRLDDQDGLECEVRAAKALGFFGKSAIHPQQIDIINRVFTPKEEEVARAREIINAATAAAADGVGALRLPGGDFIDIPVVRRAESLLLLAARLGVAG
jgi:citrate lyase subunit beta/citryl-CoA lyase